MKLLLLSTSDYHGAGLYALDYTRYLRDIGHDAILFVKEKTSNNSYVTAYNRTFLQKVFERVYRLFRTPKPFRTDQKYHFHHIELNPFFPRSRDLITQVNINPDYILVFWVSGFLDSHHLKALQQRTQAQMIIMTADPAPFTGGCHYAWDCEGYKKACQDCPAILESASKDYSAQLFAKKRDFYQKVKPTVIMGSENLKQMARESALTTDIRHWFQFAPINSKEFSFKDSERAKKKLDLPLNKKVIFLAAAFLEQERKGIKYALSALNLIADQYRAKVDVILVGNNAEALASQLELQTHILGYVDRETLINCYHAAHVFLCPSVEDAGPIMVNQSIMCGTPVVGFPIGVLPTIIKNKSLGYLAPLFESDGLAKGIKYFLDLNDKDYFDCSSACRKFAEDNYDIQAFQQNFSDLLNCLQEV